MCQSGVVLWILMHVSFKKGVEIHCKVSQSISLSVQIIFLPNETFKPLPHWSTYPWSQHGRDYMECGSCQSLWSKGRLVNGVMTIKNTYCSPSHKDHLSVWHQNSLSHRDCIFSFSWRHFFFSSLPFLPFRYLASILMIYFSIFYFLFLYPYLS